MGAANALFRSFIGIVPVLAFLYIGMGIRFIKRRRKDGNVWYPVLLFCCAAYALAYFAELQLDDTGAELILRGLSLLALAYLPAFGILFIHRLTAGREASGWAQGILFSVSFSLWLLFALNPLHGLFYGEPAHHFIGDYSVMYFARGPLFLLVYGYCLAFLLYSLWQLHQAMRNAKRPSDKRRHALLLAFFASILPCVAWLLLGMDRIIDPTPAYMVFLGSLSLWAEGKNDLMQTQITRWADMFATCEEPSFLFRGGEMTGANDVALSLPGLQFLPQEAVNDVLEQAAARHTPAGFPKDAPQRWLDVRKSVFDPRRMLVHYQLTDVTDKRRQHQRLRASEEQYRLLITQMQQGLAVFEAEEGVAPDQYVCLHGNEAFAKSVGIGGAAQLPGHEMGEVFPIMDEEWQAALRRAAAGEEVPRFERYWLEKSRYFGIRVYAPLKSQVAVILSDITERKSIERDLRRKDQLLIAITSLTQDLMQAREYREIIPQALHLVGEALDVSRGYLFECALSGGRITAVSQRFEWCSDNAVPQIDNPILKEIGPEGMEGVLAPLQAGQAFAAHIMDMPAGRAREMLEIQDIQSVLLLPVFAGSLMWGFVGFDECRCRRDWTDMEQGVLRLFADSLGRAVERYDNEHKLREAQERNEAMLHAIPDLFFIITPEGRITHYHASMRAEEMHASPDRFLQRWVWESFPKEVAEPMLCHVREALSSNAMQLFEYSLNISGQDRYFEGRVLPINQESVLLLARDISERRRRMEEIRYLSFHDQLTGLYNRRHYKQQVSRMDKPENLPLAIIMADLNGLKLTNDAFGHQMGDALLTRTAEVLRRVLDEECIFHMGGDEFVLLLPNTDARAAEAVCRRIQREVDAESTGMLVFSVSLGYSVKRSERVSLSEVFRQAEDDMYRHKLLEGSQMRKRAVQQILQTLYQKSPREMKHSKNVGELCGKIALAMGLDGELVEQARQAGVMHDIGKIGIDEAILEKTTRLNEGEMREVRRHSEVGYRLLNSVNALAHLAVFVLEHHERWDGGGYPEGISGENISLISRIIAVADGYDAMISPRTYKQPMTPGQALLDVRRCAGKQYDPLVARALVEGVMGEGWEIDVIA